ncbi:hypothetical protein IWW51_003273, partial [Coemansia sp. RSA 2702]
MSQLPPDNDYSYLVKERHSADIDASQAADIEQSMAGRPYAFQSKTLHAPDRVRDALSASAFSLHAPATRQSQASIPADGGAIGLTQTASHQPPATTGHLQPMVLKRAGSAVPNRSGKERILGSGSSITSVPSASKWFRRGRNRSASKQKQSPNSDYH